MIQLLSPSDPAESIASSHFYMMVTALFLLFGKSLFAALTSSIVVFILFDQAHISNRLEKWLLVSVLGAFISGGSWVLFFLSQTYTNVDDINRTWFFGMALQKLGGLLIGHLVYKEAFAIPTTTTTTTTTTSGSSSRIHSTSDAARSISGVGGVGGTSGRGGDSKLTKQPTAILSRRDSLVKTVRLIVHIKQGRGLVAKDTNLFGKKTTSDPYAKVYLGSTRTQLGQTKVKSKTLSPVWNQTFRRTILARSLTDYKHIICHLFDHDHMSKDDPMGTVIIPLPSLDDLKLVNWYPVSSGEGDMLCENATGEVLVEVELQS